MAVTFTTNLGLAKPDESEVAKNWTHATKLAEDNNLIIIDKTDVDYLTYVPTFIGSSSNPNIGNTGTISGEYIDFQGIVIGMVAVLISGSGIANGSGIYGVSLPFVVDPVMHTVESALANAPGAASIIGEGYLTDSSVVDRSGTVAVDVATVGGVSYARFVTETYTGKTARHFRDAMPFSLATGDQFAFNFLYKKV